MTEDKPKEYQQFSRGSSYLTLETLSRVVRPGNEKLYSEQRPISWKTGTSYGLKDAWSVGVSPDYTVLVWLGNFNQKSIFSLSGVETAGNLLFKVFNIVDINSKTFEKPTDDLKEIEIDEKDYLSSTVHIGYYNNEKLVGVARITGLDTNVIHIGRVAIAKSHRGLGLGTKLISACESVITLIASKSTVPAPFTIELSSQLHAEKFYEKLGYMRANDTVYLEAGIQHIDMKKTIS